MSYPTYDSASKEVRLGDEVIGHVVRRARVAAGRGVKNDRGTLAAGTRAHFWTAVPLQGNPSTRMLHWRPGDGASIGTRFERPADAMNALVLFHTVYSPGGAFWHNEGAMKEWRQARKRSWGF